MIRPVSCLALILSALMAHAVEPLNLVLPTENRALLEGKPEDYYMYTTRNFENVSSKPWTAGQYGFVRNLRRTKTEGVIATKFHEGIDIRPVRRDNANNALDPIRAIANGTVVYINKNKGSSSYGKYVVIRHDWDCGPFYSLYAHLSTINAQLGQPVTNSTEIGIMGFTGAGLNRERSHLHLELNMMASEKFDDWYGVLYGNENPRGIHHGWNLIGLNIAGLFLAQEKNPDISIPQFIGSAPPYFKVAFPRKSSSLSIAQRYSWLKKGDHSKPSPAWEMSFTDSGIPLSVTPSFRKVSKPTVTFVRTTRSRHEYYTRKRLQGTGRKASLTRNGIRFIELLSEAHSKPTPKPARTTSDDT